MKRLYVSAPVDEVRLAELVAPSVRELHGRLPTSIQLRSRTASHGVDHATMELYQAIRAAPEHRAFIEALDAAPVCTNHAPIADKLLIVPALFHGHYPESGANAEFAADVARACGYEVQTVPVRSVATTTENAAIIRDFLRQETAQRIWVFAVSKGSADFRAFLQLYPDTPAIDRIAGWINVCGLPAGCQIADFNIATRCRSLKYRAICRLFGTSFDLMHELSTRHPYWQGALQLPHGMQAINFMAIPLGCHIQTSLVARYSAISSLGPNDGMVSCRDSVIEPGLIYPVWGCDHFFRGPQVIPLLYRFFAWLRQH